MRANRLKGLTALVTGAGTGMGRAISLRFAEEGARVIAVGRRGALLEETVAMIRSGEGTASHWMADVSRSDDVDELAREVRQTQGGLDILVNAAGVMRVGLLAESAVEDFDAIFNSNVKGIWLMSRAFVPLLRGRKAPNIINISSIAGTRTDPGLGLFQASKAAVNSLTKVLARELAKDRIRVNAIAPGPTDTEFFKGSVFGDDMETSEHVERFVNSVPFGRLGTPEEVARLAVFFASPESDFISGSITSIDGAMGY
jgi:3-oxoacyl-[acyl-carrier protein] reductase